MIDQNNKTQRCGERRGFLFKSSLRTLRLCGSVLAAVLMLAGWSAFAVGQDSSLMLEGNGSGSAPGGPLQLQNSSFMFQELPPDSERRELREHDIIKVIVDWRASVLSEGDAENRRVTNLNAVLADWLKFTGKDLIAAPQAGGDLRINGQLTSQFRTQSELELRDSLTFTIAAEVVDIRPNGNLVIQADQQINLNEENWMVSLTGEVARQSVGLDRTVRSSDLIHLRLNKGEKGFVRDGYARGWFTKWYDRWKPF